MRFAHRVFLIGGLLGLVLILPMYLAETSYNAQFPPAISHPEFFYGFIGVVLAWQVGFLVIAADPARFRPLMVPAMLEKFTFVAAIAGLLLAGRAVPYTLQIGAVGDLILGILFVMAFWKTRPTD